MQTIWFKTDSHHYTTRERDPEDSWDRGSTDGYEYIIDARLSTPPGFEFTQVDYPYVYYGFDKTLTDDPAQELKLGDQISVVYCNYGTGDTFGNDGGHLEVLLVTTDHEKAQEFTQNYDSYKKGYAPWDGYFEWFQFIEHKILVLQP
jgi:hypothetical protein